MAKLKMREKADLVRMARSHALGADFEHMERIRADLLGAARKYTADDFIIFATAANSFANHAQKKKAPVTDAGFVL